MTNFFGGKKSCTKARSKFCKGSNTQSFSFTLLQKSANQNPIIEGRHSSVDSSAP